MVSQRRELANEVRLRFEFSLPLIRASED